MPPRTRPAVDGAASADRRARGVLDATTTVLALLVERRRLRRRLGEVEERLDALASLADSGRRPVAVVRPSEET